MNTGTAGQQQQQEQQQQQQQQEPQQKKGWKNSWWFRLLVYLCLVITGGAIGWGSRGYYEDSKDGSDAPVQEPDPQPQPKYYNNNNRPYNGGNDRGGQK